MTKQSKCSTIFPIFNFHPSEKLGEKIRAKELHFSNKTILRLITPNELEQFKGKPIVFWGEGAHLIPVLKETFYVFEVKDEELRADLLIYEVLLAMRLHKSDSIFCKLFISNKESGERIGIINPPVPWAGTVYCLNFEDVERIDNLVERIHDADLENNPSFRVAYERFSRSHEERRVDDRIIDLVIAFEALFTDERTPPLEHMGEFAGLGCSMLLGQTTKERKEIRYFLKKAFNIRNKIMHNLKLEKNIEVSNKKYSLEDFCTKLQTYLRFSLMKLL